MYKMYVIDEKKVPKNPMFRLYAMLFFLCLTIYVFSVADTPYKIKKPRALYINGSQAELIYDIRVDDKSNDKIAYISLSDVKRLFDQNIFFVETKKQVITTYDNKIGMMNLDDTIVEINGKKEDLKTNLKVIKTEVFLPLNILKQIYNFNLFVSTEDVAIFTEDVDQKLVILNKNAKLKANSYLVSGTITQISKNKKYHYLEETDNHVKIMTDDVEIGYIKKDEVEGIITTKEAKRQKKAKEKIHFITNFNTFKSNFDKVVKSNDAKNACIMDLARINNETGKIQKLYAFDNNGFKAYFGKLKDEKLMPIGKIKLAKKNLEFEKKLLTYEGRKKEIDEILEIINSYELKGIYFEISEISDIAAFNKFIIELKPRLRYKNVILVINKEIPYLEIINIEEDYVI